MATSSLSSLGLGSSGVLSYDTIDKLRAADESAILKPIDNKITTNSSKKSDLTILSNLTTSLESVTKLLRDELSYLKRSATASNTAVSITTTAGATIQDFSIHVNSLAQRDIYQSSGFALATSTFASSVTSPSGTVVVPSNTVTNGTGITLGATEFSEVTFNPAGLLDGESLTIGGLTLTASGGDLSQSDVMDAFESLTAGATAGNTITNGNWSGTLSGFSSGTISGSKITFTSSTPNSNVTNLSFSTTGTTVTAPTNVRTTGTPAVSGLTEFVEVTFDPAGLLIGESLTIGGLTLTANGGNLSQSDVMDAFANLADGATEGNTVTNGDWSGTTLTGFSSGTISGSTITFTSSTPDEDVTNLSISSTGTAPSIVTTEGILPISGVTESSVVSFNSEDLVDGESITIGGLTLTATGSITQAEVVAAFESLTAGDTQGNTVTNGTWSGTLTGFDSGTASGTSLTFTSTTPNATVPALVVSTSGTTVAQPTLATTDGYAPSASGITESSLVAFDIASMAAGDTMTIGGLTLTATGTITQAEAVAAFASLTAGATAGNTVTNGTWSGTLAGFSSGVASGTSLTFTSTTADSNVTDLAVSATRTGGTVAVPSSYTFSIGIGDKTYTLDMTSSTTLTQLKDLINDKTDGKVTASILNVGGTNPYKLVIKSNDVGTSNAITFSSTSSSALKNLGLDSTSIVANRLQTASDASFTYNGVAISRTSNTISDLVNGVTITLNEKQAEGITTNVSVKQDLGGIKDNLTSLVAKYNDLMANLKESTKYDSDTKLAGTFQSTSQIKNLSSSINRQILSTDTEGRSILDYGVSLDATGILKFDSAVFDTKVTESATDLEDFFRGSTTYSPTSFISNPLSSSALDFGSGDLNINGVSIIFTSAGGSAATNALALKNAINAAGLTGIEATLGTNNNIQLTSSSGYDIEITGVTSKLSSVGFSTTSILTNSTKTDGFFTKFDDLLKSYVDGTSSILGLFTTQLEAEKTSLTKQRLKSVTALDKKYEAMATRFAAYDSMISKLNTQFETLSQQIKASYSSN